MNSFEAMHCDTNVIYNISVYEGKFVINERSKYPISEMGVLDFVRFGKRIKSLFHKQNIPEKFSTFPIYKHFKGDYYFFKGIAYFYKEDCDYVIYIQQKSGKIFIRKYSDFFKVIKRENYSGKRFKRINKKDSDIIYNKKHKPFFKSGDWDFSNIACNGKSNWDISLSNTKKRLNNIFSFVGINKCIFDDWDGNIKSINCDDVKVFVLKNKFSDENNSYYGEQYNIEILFNTYKNYKPCKVNFKFKIARKSNRYSMRGFELTHI